jgi:hypothetical protein
MLQRGSARTKGATAILAVLGHGLEARGTFGCDPAALRLGLRYNGVTHGQET